MGYEKGSVLCVVIIVGSREADRPTGDGVRLAGRAAGGILRAVYGKRFPPPRPS